MAVTGITSGIGRAAAVLFASSGARVVGNGRRVERGRVLEYEAGERGEELVFVPGDVRRPTDCEALVAEAVRRHGRLDVLVNNAGSGGADLLARLGDVTEDDWDLVLDTNLKGPFFTAQAAARQMRTQGGGVIINVASLGGTYPATEQFAYRSAKAGLIHLGKGLAQLLAVDGIRVHTLLVSSVLTEAGERMMDARTKDLPAPEAAAIRAERGSRAVTPEAFAEGLLKLILDPTTTEGPNFTVV